MNGKDLENVRDTFWKQIPYKPKMRNPETIECSKCGKNFNVSRSLKHAYKTCPDCRGKPLWAELKKLVIKSHEVHTEPYKFLECKICGYRAKEIANHVATHGIKSNEYGITKSQESIDRMKGDNNPGFEHHGRLSPFSEKFKKYKDGSAKYTKEEVFKKRNETIKLNPQNRSTKLEYWVKMGLDENAAKEALKKRQSTFSLEKCVERYGEERGHEIWKARQDKWLHTLNLKSEEEKNDINRRKATKINYRTLWGNSLNIPGTFYIIRRNDKFKIGITSKTTQRRWQRERIEILFEHHANISECFKIEQLIKTDNQLKAFRESQNGYEGWTETFNAPFETLLDRALFYINNFEKEFNLRYPKHAS